MKSLPKHIKESFEKGSIKIVYHFSYDINSGDDRYKERKSELDEIIENTTPAFNEDICGSTKILGYDNANFNLFKVLENEVDENITYCLSVVKLKEITKKFDITDSEKVLKSSGLNAR